MPKYGEPKMMAHSTCVCQSCPSTQNPQSQFKKINTKIEMYVVRIVTVSQSEVEWFNSDEKSLCEQL